MTSESVPFYSWFKLSIVCFLPFFAHSVWRCYIYGHAERKWSHSLFEINTILSFAESESSLRPTHTLKTHPLIRPPFINPFYLFYMIIASSRWHSNSIVVRRILLLQQKQRPSFFRSSMSSSSSSSSDVPFFPVTAAIHEKLSTQLKPIHLQVMNESHMHNV